MIAPIPLPRRIAAMIGSGALVAINHSGGKDSQAMTLRLLASGIPRDQIVIVYADLGDIVWPGTLDHIRDTTHPLPIIIAKAKTDFFAMVRRRGFFPTPAIRQCTSDLKRGPIERELRRYLKTHPRFGGRIISCIGIRAEESRQRSRQVVLRTNARQSLAGRDWVNWLPVHNMSTSAVFETIATAGQQPHPIYAQGLSRCSCSFCIMASRADLRRAAALRPDLAERYARLEAETGHRFQGRGLSLADLIR